MLIFIKLELQFNCIKCYIYTCNIQKTHFARKLNNSQCANKQKSCSARKLQS